MTAIHTLDIDCGGKVVRVKLSKPIDLEVGDDMTIRALADGFELETSDKPIPETEITDDEIDWLMGSGRFRQ